MEAPHVWIAASLADAAKLLEPIANDRGELRFSFARQSKTS